MYLPDSYTAAVVFMFITMLCLGSWANTVKIDRSWRFELFYMDYALGVLLFSVVLGGTMGSLGNHGETFIGSLCTATFYPIMKALLGGVLFNIANILLVASVAIAGIAVAFSISIGTALVVGSFLSFIVSPHNNVLVLFLGMLFIVAAIIFVSAAYKRSSMEINLTKKGIGIASVSGVLMSLFYPLIAESIVGRGSLNPYSSVFLFAVGLFVCNLFVGPLFIRKPLSGPTLKIQDYFRGSSKHHMWGLLGGVIWCLGMTFNVIGSIKVSPGISYAFTQLVTLVAALWGIFIWKEFKSTTRVNSYLGLMFICYLVGLYLIGYAKHLHRV